MAAKRIAQISVDWTALAERVPPNQKALFTAFKAKSDSYLRRVLANPEVAPKIDWDYYKSRIAVKGMVDEYQKQYNALKIPYPEDKVSPLIDAEEKEAAKKIAEFVKESNERIASYQAEVEKLKGLLPYEQMTMEDFREAFPDQALDPINRPTFWPHTPEEQLGYQQQQPGGH